MKISEPNVYESSRIYQLFALIGGVVTLLLAWELRRDFGLDWIFFFVLSATFALINLRWALTRAELTPSGVTLHEPLQATIHVNFRQMVAVNEAGRIVPGISVVYYPLDADGLVDVDEPKTLFLPALDNQDELLTILNRKIPQ